MSYNFPDYERVLAKKQASCTRYVYALVCHNYQGSAAAVNCKYDDDGISTASFEKQKSRS